MGNKAPKKTKEELDRICEQLVKKDEQWATALWELVECLVHMQFARRQLTLTKEKEWDAATEIYVQLKQRIDCVPKKDANGELVVLRPIENIVSYVYYALPKRFSKWCQNELKEQRREKEMIRIDKIDPESGTFSINTKVDRMMAIEAKEPAISRELTEYIILKWLGKARNNMDLKQRKQRLRMLGWEIMDGKLVPARLSTKEMARELASLEAQKEVMPSNEKRRVERIKLLRKMLYGEEN